LFGCAFETLIGAGDAVDMTAHDLAVARQLDLGRISHPDRGARFVSSKQPSTP